jgi:hypothetical protein
MEGNKIYVLVIYGEYGINVSAFTREEKARDKIAAYVAEWWNDEPDDDSYVLITTTVE